MDAHFVRGLLESEGIESIVQGQHLEALQGMIPFGVSSACTVWVLKSTDEQRALNLIQQTIETVA